ncbi:MAG TPA: tetratricopeptide repeat protein [bacterium]|nr:tetratricopeptide repeat protein [bacterium]HOL35518.1 tetratricopeptide repeat protein [bacterium]HPP08517.1 tetratricopeptide repeat protein [bacterium]
MNKTVIKNILLFFGIFFSVLSIVWFMLPYNRAVILWKNGQHQKAISIWTNEIEKHNDINSYQRLIEIFINEGNYDRAEQMIKRALTYYPDCVNFLFYHAVVNFYKGNYEKSFHYTEQVIGLNRYFPEVYLLRGLIFEKQRYYTKAIQEFVKEINNNPGSRLAWAKLQEFKNANH